jgi:hypothetical protein
MGKLIKLVLGGAIVAFALKNKEKVAGLIGGGSSAPAPYNPPGPAPAPPVANADVAGPPENTATAVPAPEPVVHPPTGGIDEAAEEAAAAAEAANIGGPAPDYPDPTGEATLADPADVPLEEAGEGVSEGQEIAEADLVDNAEPAAGDPIEGERAIEDVIEAQDDPGSGEVIEEPPPAAETRVHQPPPPPSGAPVDLAPPPGTPAPDTEGTLAPGTGADGAPTTGGSLSGMATPPDPPPPAPETKARSVWQLDEQPTVEQPPVAEEDEKS